MIIYFVRHGYSFGNMGVNIENPPLTEIGLKQAQCVGERFKNIDFDDVIASPLTRAAQTAAEIEKKSNFKKTVKLFNSVIEINDTCRTDLEEIKKITDYDDFAILKSSHIGKREDNENERYRRAMDVVNYLKENYSDDQKVLLVSHGVFIRYFICAILFGTSPIPYEFEQANCGVNKIEISNTKITRVYYLDDNRHIPNDLLSAYGKKNILE